MEKWWCEAEAISELKNRIRKLEELRQTEFDNPELGQTIVQTKKDLRNLKQLQYDCFILQTNKSFLFGLYKKNKLPTHVFLQYAKENGELDDLPSIAGIYLTAGKHEYEEAELACINRRIGVHIYDRNFDPDFPRFIGITELGKRFVTELKELTSKAYFLRHPDLELKHST